MFYVILLYALFASVFTIAKRGLDHVEPFFFVGTRMLLAGILLVGFQVLVKKEKLKFQRDTLWNLILLAIISIYLTNAFEFWGLKYLTSFKTCFIYSLSPFLSALFSYWMFSEKLTNKKWIGLFFGFLGFIPILINQTTYEETAGTILFFSWPELSVMLAAIASVYGWILLKQLVNQHQLSPLTANGVSMSIGGVIALIHSFMVENWDPLPITNYSIYLEATVLLIIISNFICYNLYGFLLKRYSATFISVAGSTTPLFTALFGWFFLGEIVTWPFYLSFAMVFSGLLVFHQEELKQTYQIANLKASKT